MSQPQSFPVLPFSVAIGGIATFATMDVLMKGLAIELGAYNAMLWRTLLALLMASVLILWFGLRWPGRTAMRLHVLRGVVTSVMAFLFFWGLVYVPLAEAIGLSFIAPLIALYLAAVLLGEKVGGKSVLASLIGLAGAVIIVTGKLSGQYEEDIGKGIAAILLSAVMYAYNLILQRQQALIAPPVEIVFFQNATVVAVYLAIAPFYGELPAPDSMPGLAAAAALGIASMMLLSWAYARAEAQILIPVEYTAFLWASLFGWLVFAEALTLVTVVGTGLIVAGCLVAARQEPERVEHVETTGV